MATFRTFRGSPRNASQLSGQRTTLVPSSESHQPDEHGLKVCSTTEVTPPRVSVNVRPSGSRGRSEGIALSGKVHDD
jgi:hypothetical protein